MFGSPLVGRSAFVILLLFSAVLLGNGDAAKAVVATIYTDKTAWENALSAQFSTEDFSDDQLNSGVSFVSGESGHINPALECYQDVLASTSQNEPQTTWSFTPQITGYGGNWTLGGPGGSGNSLLVYIADSSHYVGAISNSYNGGFWGFISDTPFTSVTLIGGSGSNQQIYSLDDMVYSSVPEPSADFDGDGDVDPFDLLIWQAGFESCSTHEDGDADFDADVDAFDLLIWQNQSGGAASAVPEPSTLVLLGMAVVGLLLYVRRR